MSCNMMHIKQKVSNLTLFDCEQVPALQSRDLPREGEESAPPSGESFHSAKQREQHEQSQSGTQHLTPTTWHTP